MIKYPKSISFNQTPTPSFDPAMKRLILLVFVGGSFIAAGINAQVLYNNDFTTDQIASATRPQSGSQFEIETGDDFFLPTGGRITGATFTGLAPQGFDVSNIGNVAVEIYRVFPNDSNVSRTQGHRLLARLTYRRESIPLLMWRLIRVSQALTSLYAFRCEFNLHSE